MLILTREQGESVIIGDGEITVTVDRIERYDETMNTVAYVTILMHRRSVFPTTFKLTMGYDESVKLGGDDDESVEIKVAGFNGSGVRLGFEAPRHVQIHRQEVQDRINADNASARPGLRKLGLRPRRSDCRLGK